MPTLASPANILSIAALILLLGTVGVLVVCRLALAALLIIGPVFIVLALFEGTRGLFEGWLKSVAMFALVPLLTVVMGSGALVAIDRRWSPVWRRAVANPAQHRRVDPRRLDHLRLC